MRITFLGNFGVEYSSETHHKKSLESLGHEVIALQETQAGSEQILDEAMNSDMFVWVHTHGWDTPGNMSMETVLKYLKRAKIPTVTYHLDLWLGLQRQSDLDKDAVYRHIEHFFTCDKQMADWFNENTEVKGHYLPAGVFGDEVYMAQSQGYKHDVIFVGSKGYHPEWPYRPKLINWLQQTYGDRFAHYGGDGRGVIRGAALNQLYADTKIAVGDSLVQNFTYPYYWSDRLYEAAGRGAFQIFPQITGIQDQYVTYDFKADDDGFWNKKSQPIELVTYEFDNFEMLKNRIDYFLEHDEEREKIRKASFERTKRDHTYAKRWQHIIDEVTNG
jgi:hypothetical protein